MTIHISLEECSGSSARPTATPRNRRPWKGSQTLRFSPSCRPYGTPAPEEENAAVLARWRRPVRRAENQRTERIAFGGPDTSSWGKARNHVRARGRANERRNRAPTQARSTGPAICQNPVWVRNLVNLDRFTPPPISSGLANPSKHLAIVTS
jgi:hypothetical protein